MHLGRRSVTRRVAGQCECKGAPAWVRWGLFPQVIYTVNWYAVYQNEMLLWVSSSENGRGMHAHQGVRCSTSKGVRCSISKGSASDMISIIRWQMQHSQRSCQDTSILQVADVAQPRIPPGPIHHQVEDASHQKVDPARTHPPSAWASWKTGSKSIPSQSAHSASCWDKMLYGFILWEVIWIWVRIWYYNHIACLQVIQAMVGHCSHTVRPWWQMGKVCHGICEMIHVNFLLTMQPVYQLHAGVCPVTTAPNIDFAWRNCYLGNGSDHLPVTGPCKNTSGRMKSSCPKMTGPSPFVPRCNSGDILHGDSSSMSSCHEAYIKTFLMHRCR